MDPVGAGVGSWDTELAWHLLTVLLRIGRPAAATELAVAATAASAASYVTPQLVERLCLAPRSPLRSSNGVVAVSETAAVAFLRFMGCDVPARPVAGLRASDADSAEQEQQQQQSQQLIVQTSSSVATGEPPTHTKEEPVLHEMRETSCQPSLDKKVEPAALPLEATSYDGVNNSNLNIIAENVEITDQNGNEQPHNEVSTDFPKEQDKKIVKRKKKDAVPNEDKDQVAETAQKVAKKVEPAALPLDKKNVRNKEKHKKNEALPKEDKDQVAETAQKGHSEPNPLFKHFVVEEEVGSGPRGKAHSHHVDNERKMLERFGGRNFVIKFEGCFRSGDLDCFVLQHVKHDRPENLKKEIDLFELQWYGYCLLKALSSLHKQDLHQKLLRNSKLEVISRGKDITSQSSLKSALVIHDNEAAAGSKQPLGSKRKRSNKIPVCSDPRVDNKSMYASQAADGSGVTSAKDATSTKASLDRLNQPLYKGQKELMNLNEVQSPNQNTPAAPVSQRKRVAAPVGSVDQNLFVLTPMPLRSGGSAVAGSGLFNSKGHGKQRREGPCVGTKGFRAPEVLLRSSHQGCKVDVWSAGVTLLYLITGKTPFGGDPEQNMKEIVKLRGSEELWEVAKLHNCESSYPSELFEAKFLQSVDLRTWCVANARRPEFLKQLPDSLFDLVDKCLAVNPRCRITSEDALLHEFFIPCHESLKRQKSKLLRLEG
ncbi:hypothetical protein ACQ4PT_022621 [Festuca glaucescens]